MDKKETRTHYTLAKKLLAVEVVERMGGKLNEKTLFEVRRVLESPKLTLEGLRRWVWTYKNVKRPTLPVLGRGRITIPREVYNEDGKLVTYSERDHREVVLNEDNEVAVINVTALAKDVSERFTAKYREAADKFLERATDPEVISQMKGIDAMKSAQMASNIANSVANPVQHDIPSDIAGLIPPIIVSLRKRGIDPYAAFFNMLMRLNQDEKKSGADDGKD